MDFINISLNSEGKIIISDCSDSLSNSGSLYIYCVKNKTYFNDPITSSTKFSDSTIFDNRALSIYKGSNTYITYNNIVCIIIKINNKYYTNCSNLISAESAIEIKNLNNVSLYEYKQNIDKLDNLTISQLGTDSNYYNTASAYILNEEKQIVTKPEDNSGGQTGNTGETVTTPSDDTEQTEESNGTTTPQIPEQTLNEYYQYYITDKAIAELGKDSAPLVSAAENSDFKYKLLTYLQSWKHANNEYVYPNDGTGTKLNKQSIGLPIVIETNNFIYNIVWTKGASETIQTDDPDSGNSGQVQPPSPSVTTGKKTIQINVYATDKKGTSVGITEVKTILNFTDNTNSKKSITVTTTNDSKEYTEGVQSNDALSYEFLVSKQITVSFGGGTITTGQLFKNNEEPNPSFSFKQNESTSSQILTFNNGTETKNINIYVTFNAEATGSSSGSSSGSIEGLYKTKTVNNTTCWEISLLTNNSSEKLYYYIRYTNPGKSNQDVTGNIKAGESIGTSIVCINTQICGYYSPNEIKTYPEKETLNIKKIEFKEIKETT